jgi:hypothetical protein
VVDAVGPFTTPGGLLNLAGRATPDQLLAAWTPEDRRRLLEVKAAYDPTNMFRAGQAIVGRGSRC